MWRELYSVEPWGGRADDYRFAIQTGWLFRGLGGDADGPGPFLPQWVEPEVVMLDFSAGAKALCGGGRGR